MCLFSVSPSSAELRNLLSWEMLCCHSLDRNTGLVSKCSATMLNCCSFWPTVRNNFWIFTRCGGVPRRSPSLKNAPSSKLAGSIFMHWKWRYMIYYRLRHNMGRKWKEVIYQTPRMQKIQKRQLFSWSGDFCVWWILQRPTMLATVWQNCGCECLKCRWGGGRGMTKTAECSSEKDKQQLCRWGGVKKMEDQRRYLSKSPLQSARTGMVKGCHTGFNVFFTTSVLWQIVNLEEKEQERIKRRGFYYFF